jgi:hypothetical protein
MTSQQYNNITTLIEPIDTNKAIEFSGTTMLINSEDTKLIKIHIVSPTDVKNCKVFIEDDTDMRFIDDVTYISTKEISKNVKYNVGVEIIYDGVNAQYRYTQEFIVDNEEEKEDSFIDYITDEEDEPFDALSSVMCIGSDMCKSYGIQEIPLLVLLLNISKEDFDIKDELYPISSYIFSEEYLNKVQKSHETPKMTYSLLRKAMDMVSLLATFNRHKSVDYLNVKELMIKLIKVMSKKC